MIYFTKMDSKVKTRWSFGSKNLEDCNENFAFDMKNLLEKDVISKEKLHALVSDEERVNPALLMEIRSNSVRVMKNKKELSVSTSEKKIRQLEAVKKNEKHRQMVLVNREILKLKKDFDDKQKSKMRETKANQSEKRSKKYKPHSLYKLDKVNVSFTDCPNNSLNSLTDKEQSSDKENQIIVQRKLIKNDDGIECDVAHLHDIEKDINLIIDCFQENNKEKPSHNSLGNIRTSHNVSPNVSFRNQSDNADYVSKTTFTVIDSVTTVYTSRLEQKYFNMWIKVVQKRKENRFNSKLKGSRRNEVCRFFELLNKQKKLIKKCEYTSQKFRDCDTKIQQDNREADQEHKGSEFGSFRHRYLLQKNVIALQKCKLEEQNRVIEELKLNKIVEATKQSLDQFKDDVKESYNKFDRNLRPRVKCLANEAEIQPEENEENINDVLELHCLKVPKFIKKMEQRAKEREERHAVIKERRQQIEEERLRLKHQAELIKAEMDEEEKNKRIEELREKRKAEKLEKIRKRKEQERTRGLLVMADLHYEKKLLHRLIVIWIHEVKLTKLKMKLAKNHWKDKIKRSYFQYWKRRTDDVWREYYEKADQFYHHKLLDRAMEAWKMYNYEIILNKQVAEDWYDLHLLERTFRHWYNYTLSMRLYRKQQWNIAGHHFEGKLLWKAWCSWRTLPAINALKREQDIRKMKWRQRVLQVVPDYTPPED